MRLVDLVSQLDTLDDQYVITCAGKPDWAAESPAGLVWVDEFAEVAQDLPIPDYFLEVFVAREVLEVWRRWRGGRNPGLNEKCEALIYYAKNDAYIPTDVRP